MSYEDEMKITKTIWDDSSKGSGYHYKTIEVGDYRNMPLSKLPVRKKLYRAIMEKCRFSNLSSNTGVAINWFGDTYVISCRPTWDTSKVWDIAVGTKGEYPFMFRSPYTGDPTSGIRPVWDCDTEKMKMGEASPRQCYFYYYSDAITTRLGTLGFDIYRTKTVVGRKMNESTHKMNNIYASVPHLIVRRALITPPEIGTFPHEIMTESGDNYNPAHFKSTDIPLFKYAWYFRDGTIASESQAMTIDVNQI